MKQVLNVLVIICTILTTNLVLSTHAQDDPKQYLDPHNTARAEVGASPLVWNHTLASYAQNFAKEFKKKCVNMVSSNGSYGENVAAGYGAFTTQEAIGQWLSEKPNYNPQLGDCIKEKECQHYKQIIWKQTTQLGCASSTCGAGWPFVVCEYFPRGNVPGKKPY